MPMTKICTKCNIDLELKMFSRKKSIKSGFRGVCKKCDKLYRDSNIQTIGEYRKQYQKENKDKRKLYLEENKESIKITRDIWRSCNRDKLNASTANRRAAKLQRTAPWSDKVAIRSLYAEARELEKQTGTKYHLDHIDPLQGDLVSGLHVENNLQILTEEQNCSKSNKFTPYCVDMRTGKVEYFEFDGCSDYFEPFLAVTTA